MKKENLPSPVLTLEEIEKQYGRDFDVRGDMHLSTLLEREGVASLNDLIKSSN